MLKMKRLSLMLPLVVSSYAAYSPQSLTSTPPEEGVNKKILFSKPRIGIINTSNLSSDCQTQSCKSKGYAKITYPLDIGVQFDIALALPVVSTNNISVLMQTPAGYPLGGKWIQNWIEVYPYVGLGFGLLDKKFGFIHEFGLQYPLSRDYSLVMGATIESKKILDGVSNEFSARGNSSNFIIGIEAAIPYFGL